MAKKTTNDAVELDEAVVAEQPVVETVEEVKKPAKGKNMLAEVNCERLNVRTEASKESAVNMIIAKGDIVNIINYSKNSEFHKVEKNGQFIGYVDARFVSVK